MSASSSYPIVLIPEPIQDAQQTHPQVIPAYSVEPPTHPGKKPDPINKGKVATHTAIAVVPAVIPFTKSRLRTMGLGVTLVMLMAIAAKTVRQWFAGKQYQKSATQYHQELPIYQEGKRQHQAAEITAFQWKLIQGLLKQTIAPDGEKSRATRGASEAAFETVLHKYFPGKIYTGKTLKIPNYPHPYTPDFIYFDPIHQLHIDIEIDEPYDFKRRQPIHYIDSHKDKRRNRFFLNKGWLIIRFSEEQVISWPDSCCQTIAEVITQLSPELIEAKRLGIQELPECARWSKRDAIQLGCVLKVDEKVGHPTEVVSTSL